ncbi:MAG: hypothetical protein ACKVUT_16955 [Gaiella sp.]
MTADALPDADGRGGIVTEAGTGIGPAAAGQFHTRGPGVPLVGHRWWRRRHAGRLRM